MCRSDKIGLLAEYGDFFGREKEIRKVNVAILFTVRTSPHLQVFIGKSRIEEKKNQRWKCVYIDLEETITEDGFLNLVIEAFCKNGIWKQVAKGMSKGLASVLERIEKISLGPVQFDFWKKEDQEDFLKELIRHDEDIFIVVDE